MGDRSAIEWTDATWNPVRDCTTVSPGCKFCYADVFSEHSDLRPIESRNEGLVDQNIVSWNRIAVLLRQLDRLRAPA